MSRIEEIKREYLDRCGGDVFAALATIRKEIANLTIPIKTEEELSDFLDAKSELYSLLPKEPPENLGPPSRNFEWCKNVWSKLSDGTVSEIEVRYSYIQYDYTGEYVWLIDPDEPDAAPTRYEVLRTLDDEPCFLALHKRDDGHNLWLLDKITYEPVLNRMFAPYRVWLDKEYVDIRNL